MGRSLITRPNSCSRTTAIISRRDDATSTTPATTAAFSAAVGSEVVRVAVEAQVANTVEIADIMHDCGYACCSSPTNVRDVLSQVPKAALTAASVARVIGMMNKTCSGLEDGIPLTYGVYGDNASYYHPPIERFDRVEVLKGAAVNLYGPQTIGGVINYITPIPSKTPTGGLSLANWSSPT